jgi:hypothetical protein
MDGRERRGHALMDDGAQWDGGRENPHQEPETQGGSPIHDLEASATAQQPPTVHLLEQGEAFRIGPHLFRITHGGLVLAYHQHVGHHSSPFWLLYHYDERERPESTRSPGSSAGHLNPSLDISAALGFDTQTLP